MQNVPFQFPSFIIYDSLYRLSVSFASLQLVHGMNTIITAAYCLTVQCCAKLKAWGEIAFTVFECCSVPIIVECYVLKQQTTLSNITHYTKKNYLFLLRGDFSVFLFNALLIVVSLYCFEL